MIQISRSLSQYSNLGIYGTGEISYIGWIDHLRTNEICIITVMVVLVCIHSGNIAYLADFIVFISNKNLKQKILKFIVNETFPEYRNEQFLIYVSSSGQFKPCWWSEKDVEQYIEGFKGSICYDVPPAPAFLGNRVQIVPFCWAMGAPPPGRPMWSATQSWKLRTEHG